MQNLSDEVADQPSFENLEFRNLNSNPQQVRALPGSDSGHHRCTETWWHQLQHLGELESDRFVNVEKFFNTVIIV